MPESRLNPVGYLTYSDLRKAILIQITSADSSSRIVLTESGAGYRYHVEVARDGQWTRVTAKENIFLNGPSFDLAPTSVIESEGRLSLSGTGKPAEGDAYRWRGTISRVDGSAWFKFELEIDSSGFGLSPLAAEPQILLDLGPLPPYERGDHVWFKTLVQNPTQWNHEAQGNDFPATYFYDPYSKAEFQLFFDMTEMAWMGPDNMARFYDYRCGIRRTFGGEPSLELGLLGETKSGSTFPAGPQRFVWYLSARHRMDVPSAPTEQVALIQLVQSSLALLRSSAEYWPGAATSWADYALHTAEDLMSSEHSWSRDEHGEHLLNYVDGRSDAWVNAMTARGLRFDGLGPCLESALWALRPIDVLQTRLADAPFAELQHRLESFIRRELQLSRSQMLTGVTNGTLPIGTWQYIYKVAESWEIYAARNDREMLDLLREEIVNVVIPLAQNTQYLFPLQFDKSTLTKIGPGDGNAISGIFALLMISLHKDTGDLSHLEHARRALRALANLPIDSALQEVFLIAQAFDAADRLLDITGEKEWMAHREYFQAQTLRMMYWYDDRTSAETKKVSHLGMFLACANINYPAFLENIEVDARLAAGWRGDAPIANETLRVLDYGRRNNFSFFPKSSPDLFGKMPLDYIPFEEVPILEGPADAGFVGQEIYGAGWAFRAHLLWDALATSDDREVMLVSLDAYREGSLQVDKAEWDFVAYNPTSSDRQATLTFPVLGGRTGSLEVEGVDHRIGVDGGAIISLPAGENLTMTLRAS